MEVSRCHRGKRGKVAGRGKESPEGKGLDNLLSYDTHYRIRLCKCAHIFLCFPSPLARPPPQRTLSNFLNEGDALRERASSTHALPDLATRTHFTSLSSSSCLPTFHT
jgi:hypothetical protein